MATSPVGLPAPLVSQDRLSRLRDLAFQLLALFGLMLTLAVLVTLVTEVVRNGIGVLTSRGTDFLTGGLSTRSNLAGIGQGIRGSVFIAAFVLVISLPIGVATAIYLEEYAPDNRVTRFISLNIRNLAGVPSIVYGLLGLSIFVQLLGPDTAGNDGLVNFTGGRTVLSAGLTIAILVLPIVVIAASEALRAVPDSLRQGGYALGSTRWEVTRSLTLPHAAPGVMTGTILSLSRAIGETAPLVVIGATTGFLAYGDANVFEQLRGPFTAMPTVVYEWAQEARPEFRVGLASAGIVVLLAITLVANAVAIVLRNRYERRREQL